MNSYHILNYNLWFESGSGGSEMDFRWETSAARKHLTIDIVIKWRANPA
jgi:hypothetical protein